MHEMSLFKDILEKIEKISKENGGKKIIALEIKLGALSHLSKAHFIEHFELFSKGTAADGAELTISLDSDRESPSAQGIVLESVEIEQ